MFSLLVVCIAISGCLAQNNPWTPQPRDATWMKRHETLLELTKQHGKEEKLIFVGDSITEGWVWDPKSRDIWAKHYTPRHAYNYGIGGDRTEHVIWRIQNKEFDGLSPKVAVLMIGTNNLGGTKLEDIAHGVQEVLKELEAKMPGIKIILLGILPRAEPLGTQAKNLNVLIKKFADGNTVHWLDMWSAFEGPNGQLKTELYFTDHLHLNGDGYDVWQKTMEPLLNQLLPMA